MISRFSRFSPQGSGAFLCLDRGEGAGQRKYSEDDRDDGKRPAKAHVNKLPRPSSLRNISALHKKERIGRCASYSVRLHVSVIPAPRGKRKCLRR
jgi:hypothetical protein